MDMHQKHFEQLMGQVRRMAQARALQDHWREDKRTI